MIEDINYNIWEEYEIPREVSSELPINSKVICLIEKARGEVISRVVNIETKLEI